MSARAAKPTPNLRFLEITARTSEHIQTTQAEGYVLHRQGFMLEKREDVRCPGTEIYVAADKKAAYEMSAWSVQARATAG